MKAIEQYLPGAVRILPGRGGGGGVIPKKIG